MTEMALEAQAQEVRRLRKELEQEKEDYKQRLQQLEDRSIPQSSAFKIAEALADLKSL